MTMMTSTTNTKAIALAEQSADGNFLARLAGQAVAHPFEEPGKGGNRLGNHDEHEHHRRSVTRTDGKAAGDNLELEKNVFMGGTPAIASAATAKTDAADGVLLEHAAQLGHARAERKGERTGDEEEQRLGKGIG